MMRRTFLNHRQPHGRLQGDHLANVGYASTPTDSNR
jgi:hypothetical protein